MLATTVLLSCSIATLAAAANPSLKLKTYVDVLDLDFSFNPIIAAYWTGLPHHRRTPFAVSPDGKTGYIAYLDASGSDVHVQQINAATMNPKGSTVTIKNVKEAGGLVAHNRGFALLGNEPIPASVANAPPGNTPVPAIYRHHNGKQQWKTFVAGPGLHASDGLSMAPDMNGDLVWSDEAQLYGAYFVVTDYTGFAASHFGDSIQYVNETGALQTIDGASSSWGCSHNTGIAFEAADQPPYASICAEDQGAIWLNTQTQGMTNNGVKISNENTTNGASGEPSTYINGQKGNSSHVFATWSLAWSERDTPLPSAVSVLRHLLTLLPNTFSGRNVWILFSTRPFRQLYFVHLCVGISRSR